MMRNRLIYLLFGAVFAAGLVGLAVALHHVLPPQPRWRVRLEKGEHVTTVETVHGRIFTHNREGISAIDIFSGNRLGPLLSGKNFTWSCHGEFSPNRPYYAIRFDNGRKIGVVRVQNLRTEVIELHAKKKGYDQFPSLDFSPDSKWLAAGIRYENGPPVKVVVVDPATGKSVFETGKGTFFRSFALKRDLMVCEKLVGYIKTFAVSLWSLKTGKRVSESPSFLRGWTDRNKSYHYYPREWSTDRQTLIGCRKTAEGKVELVAWDVFNNRLNCIIPVDAKEIHYGPRFSPDGKRLVFALGPKCNKLVFFNLRKAKIENEFELDEKVWSVWFLSDSVSAVCRILNDTFVIHAATGEVVKKPPGIDAYHWAFLLDGQRVYRIEFKGKHRRLSMNGEFTFYLRNQQTKRIAKCGPFRTDSCWPPNHQVCSRLMFIRSGVDHRPHRAREFVRQWLPLNRDPTNHLHCVDTATGRKLGRLAFTDTPKFRFSEKHNLLATWHPENNHVQLACWDVPFRPPWTWVLGPPLVLGLLGAGFVFWRRRMIQKAKKKLTNVDC